MNDPYELAEAERLDLASLFLSDPVASHEIIFEDDNLAPSAPFHEELITAMHGPEPYELFMCFRGSAKSTKAERAISIMATAGQVNNCMIVGANEARAIERLTSISAIIRTNKWLRYLYGDTGGDVEGDTWRGSKIVLKSGAVVWALGCGQAVLGTKHLSYRPDYVLVDDLEDEDSTATEAARLKVNNWYWGALIPAMAPPGHRRIRVLGTPWHPKCLLVNLSKNAAYKSHVIPVEYVDDKGVRQPSWPGWWPLNKIDEEYEVFVQGHNQRVWAMQYMVQAVDPQLQLFKEENFIVEPRVRTWEPVYISYDPARSTKETSATTGIVAASYVGRRLVVWEARCPRILPSEIVDDVFRMEEKYEPVRIGIEKDGLEEFLMEPLRDAQLSRGQMLPLEPLQAPRRRGGGAKDDFITKLQPMYSASEIIFAGSEESFKDAKAQILSFPVGDKDILNALAYIPQLRGGQPVYDDTSGRHVHDGKLRPMGAFNLAVNAGSYGSAAVLFQYSGNILLVHRDWISDAPAGNAIPSWIQEAHLETGKNVLVLVPPFHFDTRNSFGLLAALRGRAEGRKGGDGIRGREFIRELLRGEVRGSARLLLGEGATWTRRAMLGGFVWDAGRTVPRDGLYTTLMEALESGVAPAMYAKTGANQPTAYTEDGVAYNSADPNARGVGWSDNPKERLLDAQSRVFGGG